MKYEHKTKSLLKSSWSQIGLNTNYEIENKTKSLLKSNQSQIGL